MLDQNNVLAQIFRYARDRYKEEDFTGVKMRLIRHRSKDGRTYNLPTASEVAALIVGLQYPLLFPYKENGYKVDVKLKLSGNSKDNDITNVSMGEFVSFILQNRDEKSHLLFQSRKLFQQFIVYAYTMIEAERLNFIRFNQPQLRADLYKYMNNALNREDKTSIASDIDRMISAAIPNDKEDPTLFAAVETYMMHGPCGQANLNSPCMKDLTMSDEEIKNNVLAKVEKILHGKGRSLRDYATMPFPFRVLLFEVHNKLIIDELSYDRASLTELHKMYLSCLTVEQKFFYDEIISTASENK
ncbi:hypothetical protein QYF36_025982 [Acer negundo]|nr:hypothetical protein QYF36_025982 [Acer negundo]